MNFQKPSIICLIPAKKESIRLPNKNCLPLKHLPLITRTIRTAKATKVFAKIVVLTDSPQIKQLALKEKVSVEHLPPKLTKPTVQTTQVVLYYLKKHNIAKQYNIVVKLLTPVPFRNAQDIKKALKLLNQNSQANSIVSVTQYEFPPRLALSIKTKPWATPLNPKSYGQIGTRQCQTLYHPNGALFISKIKPFLKQATFFGKNTLIFEMPHLRSLDIDYPYQYKIAKLLAKKLLK